MKNRFKFKFKYKREAFFMGIIFLLVIFPIFVIADENILINEIFPNPKGSDKDKEFVELYNNSEEVVNLGNWILRKTSKKGVVKDYIFSINSKIEKKEYFKIKFSGLNNDGAKVELISSANKLINDNEYSDAVEGYSYNRDESNKKSEWYWTNETGGCKNEDNPINKKYSKIFITEVLPNPKGEEKIDEFIELYNPGKESLSLKDWQIRDGSKTGKYIFGKDAKIKSKKFFVIYRKDFKFALNNSGGDIVKIIAPNDKVISQIKYESAKENISYNYHLKNKNWRWSKKLTPGLKNIFNNLPTFKFEKPRKIYKNIYVNFDLHKLKDRDGDKIKISWDFGDGHKSYLKKTRHKYEKTGKYKVKLSIDDGSEKIERIFSIKVRKYPRYKIKIVGIMPNPSGKDLGKEILLIKNLEKKRISLEGYKIGTGKNQEKILKHPFYNILKIKSGEVKKVVNDDTCRFSLLNTGGVVQLMYPDGKIADEVKYQKKKILPNEMYKLDESSGQWYWQGGVYKTAVNQKKMKNVSVLEVENAIGTDITLDKVLGVCKTVNQIKKDNWMDNWANKWLF